MDSQANNTSAPRALKPRLRRYWAITAVIAVGLGIYAYAHRNSSTSPSKVAAMIGASYCGNTGYYIQSRLDGSKAVIYDCTTGAKTRCVTVSGGIASDSTQEVRLLFANALGGSKPSCIL